MKLCPACGRAAAKVIYLGFPMQLCDSVRCSTLWGFWSWVATLVPISDGHNFHFFQYEGHYLPALFHWLFGADDHVGGAW